MVSSAAVALVALCACAHASVLVPTYVLPPDTFVRDQRSLETDQHAADSQRTIRRLVGGHIKIDPAKSFGDPAKNSFTFDEKSGKSKYAAVPVPVAENAGVGWNQGVWDDGMLMSSAGEGKEAAKTTKDDDEEKKTLSDQVAEGKYGLIQNEIFQKAPKRPGVISYEANPDTRSKDNVHTLGGLDKDEIWLAEDHLLVLKGGSFPEHGHKSERKPWPAIDDYEAPRRQVKLPQKPLVPPPFPVQLTDDGPLVFLTPNGSVPAALFPPFPAGESDGSIPPPPFPYPGFDAAGRDPGNSTSGGAPFPVPPFPFLPGNASERGPFPPFFFPTSMNGSFPEGFPPGAAFLPPPGNQTDLYDEDDPSIYYPPPYNFSYRADDKGSVPPGPLVPGIVLPPPPDFFAPLEERTSTTEDVSTQTVTQSAPKQKPAVKRPYSGYRKQLKPRPTTTENTRTTVDSTTTQRPIVVDDTPNQRPPQRVVQIPRPTPVRQHNYANDESLPKPRPIDKPVYTPRPRTTLKPTTRPVSIVYDYPEEPVYNTKVPNTSSKPFAVYGLPEKTSNVNGNSLVTSTPVPLRAYYNSQTDDYPKTELKPVYSPKPKENSVASFYFYDEQPKTTPSSSAYFDGRTYYKSEPINQNPNTRFIPNTQTGFTPSVNVAYGSIDQSDNVLLWPQRQGPRTLTQEYFSIQKPKQQQQQQVYVQPNSRPEAFYHQIADIQQTIDYYTTNRPFVRRPNENYKQKPATSRPVYQFSYQTKPRQEQITFRAPKLDTEPFRPMVSYSKPFNVQNEFNAISPSPSPVYHQQYLIENVKVTTETPTSSKYYPKVNSNDQDYEHVPAYDDAKKGYPKQNVPQRVQIVKSVTPQRFESTTPSALDHGYYTKQDERYVDDITKNYFEHFGKKLEDSRDDSGLAVTPPLETVRTPVNNAINLQYDDADNYNVNPPSLADDTRVNYREPRPMINPDSEFVPIVNPSFRYENLLQQIRQQQQAQYQTIPQPPKIQGFAGEQLDLYRPAPPPNLASDTAVNYNRPLPPVNPDAEFVEPVNTAGEGRPGSFVSYKLPGEGAHVYFLTPQAARDRYGYRPHGSSGR